MMLLHLSCSVFVSHVLLRSQYGPISMYFCYSTAEVIVVSGSHSLHVSFLKVACGLYRAAMSACCMQIGSQLFNVSQLCRYRRDSSSYGGSAVPSDRRGSNFNG